MLSESTFIILFFALLLDRFIGDPNWIWLRIPHPVVIFGILISWFEKHFNQSDISTIKREKYGFVAIIFLMVLSILAGLVISYFLSFMGRFGDVFEILIVAVFIAQKSLVQHVVAVATSLREAGLVGGRKAVSMIVGRDPEHLDCSGVCRATIESLAENASDGVVAPAFWFAIFGLPGLLAYKMLNTADSMIGHMSERYRAFGHASAKLDDLANWVPARLTGLLIILVSNPAQWYHGVNIMIQDAPLHRSPNAGWPESAMASVLGVALGGPRFYADHLVSDPFLNEKGEKEVTDQHIDSSIIYFWRAMMLATFFVGSLAFFQYIHG